MSTEVDELREVSGLQIFNDLMDTLCVCAFMGVGAYHAAKGNLTTALLYLGIGAILRRVCQIHRAVR